MWKAEIEWQNYFGIPCLWQRYSGQFFCNSGSNLHFFSLTFHVRVLSGDLKIAARNFSDKEVLESALKM